MKDSGPLNSNPQKPVSRRGFLGWAAGLAASGFALDRSYAGSLNATEFPRGAGSDLALGDQDLALETLRRVPRYARRGFAAFPEIGPTQVYGAGTYGLVEGNLLLQALQGGVRLVDTSPDYDQGNVEEAVGWAQEHFQEPVYVMTQLPVAAWEDTHRRVAFQRALRRSLGRLRRGDVEALLIRNAEPWQLQDPQFREFAADVNQSGIVSTFGASGHGPDIETVLELSLDDDLIEIILFGAHLARFQRIPDLLREARSRGKRLIAMKTREAGLWYQLPGWEKEAERRRHRPWDGRWDDTFTKTSIQEAVRSTQCHQALLSLRQTSDLPLFSTPR